MDEDRRSIVDALRSGARSLAQLASWQLALARDMEGRLQELDGLADGPGGGGKSGSKRALRSGGRGASGRAEGRGAAARRSRKKS